MEDRAPTVRSTFLRPGPTKRLADAERTLQTKTTKAALESKRIAGDKIEWALGKLSDLG